MARASIIVIGWNGEAYLGPCLDAILLQTTNSDEVIVVDNASTDGSVALVREHYPQVCLIENERNLGFAGGANVGLRAARGDFLILVNQDVEVREGWLEAMLEAFALAGVGIVGCKLLYPDGTIQHAGGIIRYPLAHPDHCGYREVDQGQWDKQREVDYVTGAVIGFRRMMLDRIGLFDEGFFPVFYEEADLCFRARTAGHKVVYTPDAVAMHHETTTVDREGVQYHRWMGRGRLRFLLKHYTAEQFHEDFVPAERLWLASLTAPAMRQGLRAAYLDALLGLRDMPKIGVLADAGSEEAVAEALLDLREILVVSQQEPSEVVPECDLLDELPWRIQERPFTSKVPIIGPAIARFRELWNSVATKWYVRPLIEQQSEVNRRLVELIKRLREELMVSQETVVALDREAADLRRLQAQAVYKLWQELDHLQARLGSPETASDRQEQDDDRR